MRRKMCIYKCMLIVYKNQQIRQTGSRNLMGSKTLPTIWGTYMKLVAIYQISAINSGWDKCDEKWAYMFNVYKNQQLLRKMRRKISWTEGRKNRQTEVKQYTFPPPPSGSGGIKTYHYNFIFDFIYSKTMLDTSNKQLLVNNSKTNKITGHFKLLALGISRIVHWIYCRQINLKYTYVL
jgi:hypothetical protein